MAPHVALIVSAACAAFLSGCAEGGGGADKPKHCHRKDGNCSNGYTDCPDENSSHFAELSRASTQRSEVFASDNFLGHCNSGNQYGWPSFQNATELKKSAWSTYFEYIYGSVPEVGYPICTAALKYLDKDGLDKAQISLPGRNFSSPEWCPGAEGDVYKAGPGWDTRPQSLWIWYHNVASPSGAQLGIPDNTWVEFSHGKDKTAGDATWMYYLPGTGVWFNVGKTKAYTDHDDSVRDLMGCNCADWNAWVPQCPKQWAAMYVAARKAGYTSIQYTGHSDAPCSKELGWKAMALEIVDLGGPGSLVCGSNTYRSGWHASKPCHCSETYSLHTNCHGQPSVEQPAFGASTSQAVGLVV